MCYFWKEINISKFIELHYTLNVLKRFFVKEIMSQLTFICNLYLVEYLASDIKIIHRATKKSVLSTKFYQTFLSMLKIQHQRVDHPHPQSQEFFPHVDACVINTWD